MKGKEKSFFVKAYEFILYACKRGIEFIGDHWLDIMKLIGIILLGLFSYRLYCLAMPQIEKLFTMGRDGEIRAAKNATRKLDNDGKRLQTAIDNFNDALDGKPNLDQIDTTAKTIKQRITDKAIRDYKVAPETSDLAGALNKAAAEVRVDPIEVRKQASGPGNIAILH